MKKIDPLFFAPKRVIERYHFTKKDVDSIHSRFTLTMLTIDTVFSVFIFLAMMFYIIRGAINNPDYWATLFDYPYSLAAKGVMILSSLQLIIYYFVRKTSKKDHPRLDRIVLDIFAILLAIGMMFFIANDAVENQLGSTRTISAGILWIAIICFCAVAHQVDQIILSTTIALTTILTPIITGIFYPVNEIHQYIICALAYYVGSLLFHAIFFNIVSQKYYIEHENERLLVMSNHDPLTLCLNRNGLTQLLKFKEGQKVVDPICVYVFDIDHFKQFNDNYSHLEGDKVLRHVVQTIRDTQTGRYQLVRWGGDEFVFVKIVKDRKDALAAGDELRKSVYKTCFYKNMEITISVGGSFHDVDEILDFEAFFKLADESLYQAKEAGRNRACVDGILIE